MFYFQKHNYNIYNNIKKTTLAKYVIDIKTVAK